MENTPKRINLLQLSQSPNSIAMDDSGECLSLTRLKNQVKKNNPASAAAILCVPALTEGWIGKVHFTNGWSILPPLLDPNLSCVWRGLWEMHLFPVCLRLTRELLRIRWTSGYSSLLNCSSAYLEKYNLFNSHTLKCYLYQYTEIWHFCHHPNTTQTAPVNTPSVPHFMAKAEL